MLNGLHGVQHDGEPSSLGVFRLRGGVRLVRARGPNNDMMRQLCSVGPPLLINREHQGQGYYRDGAASGNRPRYVVDDPG